MLVSLRSTAAALREVDKLEGARSDEIGDQFEAMIAEFLTTVPPSWVDQEWGR